MLVKQYIAKQYYVFTRWSRKSWALFSALGKQVKIGVTIRLGDMAYKRSLITGSFISTEYSIHCANIIPVFEIDSGQQSLVPFINIQQTNSFISFDSVDTLFLKFNY